MQNNEIGGECCASDKVDRLYVIRHSLAHVMAQSVLSLRPNARLAFGPPVENGFYYDFEFDEPLTPDNFTAIESEMRRIIEEGQEFTRTIRTVKDAYTDFMSNGQTYKAEFAQELEAKGEIELSFYSNGSFIDMCRGPHVKNTSCLSTTAFKLDSIAGAYWKGDSSRPQLSRIYALAFETKEDLDNYLKLRQLAAERDHRKLGKELELFRITDEVGPGLPLWLPNGSVIRDTLETFAKETEFRAGYQAVHTPHITKGHLYYITGHLSYYKEAMFPPMMVDGIEYYMKPMNCPHHHLIFACRPRSYKELPLRLAEYGTCYRYEESGALSGLLRVRMLSMNDAHIYCTQDQLQEEFVAVLELHKFYYQKFRISDFWMRFSTHDPKNTKKYADAPEAWASSERIIREVLDTVGMRYEIAPGEAAFYGPKVDFQIKNVIGREETASTCQLDFVIPSRCGLTYVSEDGSGKTPYCIHRAPLGTHERFVAFLVEHFGAAFPTWMSPIQVRIIPVAEKFASYAERLASHLRGELVRADTDATSESFNKRIRKAVKHKIPNILVVGAKEEEASSVTWRRYAVSEQSCLGFDEFVSILKGMIANRLMDNFPDERIT